MFIYLWFKTLKKTKFLFPDVPFFSSCFPLKQQRFPLFIHPASQVLLEKPLCAKRALEASHAIGPIGTPIWLVYNGQSIYNNAQSITIHLYMDDLGGIPFLGNLYIFELCYARKKKPAVPSGHPPWQVRWLSHEVFQPKWIMLGTPPCRRKSAAPGFCCPQWLTRNGSKNIPKCGWMWSLARFVAGWIAQWNINMELLLLQMSASFFSPGSTDAGHG